MTGPLFVGIDLGGSGTRAALADDTGHILATGRGPTGLVGGKEPSAHPALARALDTTLAAIAERVGDQPCVVCAGTRGLSIPGRRDLLLHDIRRRLPGAEVRVTGDVSIALWGGLAGRAGVVVAAGSGSIALARDSAGREGRAGGWGFMLGDEGSGYWLGRQAVRVYLGGLEGRSARAELWQAVADALGATSVTDVIAWFYGDQDQVERLTALAPRVSEAAAAGDAAAGEILARAGRALAEQAVAAARQVWTTALPVPLRVIRTGGVWAAGHALEDTFVESLLEAAPTAELGRPDLPPEGGAVLLAMGADRSPRPSAVVARLAAGLSETASTAQSSGRGVLGERP